MKRLKKLMLMIALMTLSISCSCPQVCPPYPDMPDEVKSSLSRDDSTLRWLRSQVVLKYQLEECRKWSR